ncbi:MAG: hypothetical protein KDA20_02845 [Phycisphaerales bacterium]|nr:hypothetical protein [Phycisphaerales bacterium]
MSVLFGAALIAGSAGLAAAQDAPRRAPIRERMQQRAQDRDPAAQPAERGQRLRHMLEQRLERLREQEAKIQGALDRMDQGQRPDIEPWMLEPEARSPIEGGPEHRGPRPGRPGPDDEPGLGGPPIDGRPMGRPGRGPEAGPGPGAGLGPGGRPPLPRERAMDFLRENNPRLHQRLERLREHNPEAVDQAIQERQGRFRELMQERSEHPEAFAARQEAFEAREAVHAAARALVTRPDDPAAMNEVRQAVEHAFDLQLKLREMTLGRLSDELEDARAQLAEQRSHRAEAIDARVQDVIRGAAGQPLDEPPPPPRE